MSVFEKPRNWAFNLLAPKTPFYVISHERSGTHFAINTLFRNTYVAQTFSYVGDWLGPYGKPETRYQHLDRFREEWPERRRTGGLIKSHCDSVTFVKHFPKAKVVYVLRDPRDTLVSFFHYLNSEALYGTNPGLANQRCRDFSEFLRRPATDYLRMGFFEDANFDNVVGRWASHTHGWLARPEVCVLRYEDLKSDYRACVRRACRSVGLLPRLRQQAVGLQDGASILPRKGVVGDWKNMFTVEDEEFLQRELAPWKLPEAVTGFFPS